MLSSGAAVAGLSAWGRAPRAEGNPQSDTPPPLPEPIIPEAYEGRLGQAINAMKILEADALLMPPGSELVWLTGLSLKRVERPVSFLLTTEGETSMTVAAFQQDRVTAGPLRIGQVDVWEDNVDPYAMQKKMLKKAGLKTAKVALGGDIWYNDFARIHAAFPKMTFISTSAFLGPLREVKSALEKTLIVTLSDIADWAIRRSLPEVREGMTEREIREIVWSRLDRAGVEPEGEVLTGPNSAEWWHAASGSRAVRQDDAIVITFGARLHGYWGSATRVAVLGKTSGRMKMIYDLVIETHEAVRLGTLPEMSWSAVHQRARAVLATKGFGKFIEPRMGQGLGVSLQEPPYVSRAYHVRTEVGNIVQFEPGIHTRGEYGIRSSILMEVGKTVGRFLTEPQESIIEV